MGRDTHDTSTILIAKPSGCCAHSIEQANETPTPEPSQMNEVSLTRITIASSAPFMSNVLHHIVQETKTQMVTKTLWDFIHLTLCNMYQGINHYLHTWLAWAYVF